MPEPTISHRNISDRPQLESESKLLHRIACAIASINDRKALIRFILQDVKEVFGFCDAGLMILDKEKGILSDWLTLFPELWPTESNLEAHQNNLISIPYHGSLIEKSIQEVLTAGHPLVYEINQTLAEAYPEMRNILELEIKYGYKETLFTYLKNADQFIGAFNIISDKNGAFTAAYNDLFQGVADLIAVVVANILAYERLAKQEREKRLQMEMNNAILRLPSDQEVLMALSQNLASVVPLDCCYIHCVTEKPDYQWLNYFCENSQGVFALRDLPGKAEEFRMNILEWRKQAKDFLCKVKEGQILTKVQIDDLQIQYPYLYAWYHRLNIRSVLLLPLLLLNDIHAYLVVGSQKPFAYLEEELDLLRSTIPQISLAFDHRLSLEQVCKLKEVVESEKLYLQEEVDKKFRFDEIIGSSKAIHRVFEQISIVAPTDSTVLITGATGTGKELVARALHNFSKRKSKILVKVNCASLPAQLIESELFGHEKGAFTGAHERRIGKFELANGSTIFLDEVGELPLELQAKLLRVIQEREFERLGGTGTIKLNIRIIAATNRNLEQEMAARRFRSDLFYRLNVFPIRLPALCERKEDIPLLAMHFMQRFSKKMGKKLLSIESQTLQELMLYNWPGNIRELEHVIEHSVVCAEGPELRLARPIPSVGSNTAGLADYKIKTLQENERDHILTVLNYAKGRIRGMGGAAQLLDLNPNTLESRMAKLGIKKNHILRSSP